jgi:hypothetical protein
MRVHRSFGITILLLCLAACGARLSAENFDKIHEGMRARSGALPLADWSVTYA